jgi:hypothetical protein
MTRGMMGKSSDFFQGFSLVAVVSGIAKMKYHHMGHGF